MGKTELWTKEYFITTGANFLVAMNYYLLMIVISEYAMLEFRASTASAGLAVSIFVLGALLARLGTGRLLARVGGKEILLAGAIAGVLFSLAYFAVHSLTALLALRFLHGAAFGVITTSAATIIARIVPQERRGEGVGYYSLSQTLATALGPFLGIWLTRQGSYTAIFAACTGAAALIIVITLFLSLPQNAVTEEPAGVRRGFSLSGFLERTAAPISLIALLIYLCYASVVSFLVVYAKTIKLTEAAGFFFIVYAVAVVLSRPFVGKTFDKKGEHIVMYPAIIIFGLGLLLFSTSYFAVMLLAAAVCLGLGLGAIQACTQTIVVKVSPPHRLGLANATYLMLCDIGMGAGPVLAGLVAPFTGFRGMYAITALLAFACVLLYYLFHHQNHATVG